MGAYTFRGGVHPAYHKDLSRDKEIKPLDLPSELVVPMLQHLREPCEPVVKKGEEVKKGQLIGETKAFLAAPVHAPTSGKVKAVEPRPHPMGKKITAVVIEPDGEDQWADDLKPIEDFLSPSREELISIIKGAGLVGLGGAAFPTFIKLSPPPDKKIDTVILNGAECEPYLTADHRLMLEQPEKIINGGKIILKVLGAQKLIIGIEENKEDAIGVMEEAVRKYADGAPMEVARLRVKYPQGAEKQLIHALLGREVPAQGGLPMDVGVVVQNVGTTAAIYEAVRFGKPLIERVVTLTGSGVNEPGNFLVRIGTPAAKLIEAGGGMKENAAKIIFGGPMMGVAQPDDSTPIVKGTSGVLIMTESEVSREFHLKPCIRCGKCVSVCPMRLPTNFLEDLIEAEMYDDPLINDVLDCIECGSCAYVCPAGRPIVQILKLGKAEIFARRRKGK